MHKAFQLFIFIKLSITNKAYKEMLSLIDFLARRVEFTALRSNKIREAKDKIQKY